MKKVIVPVLVLAAALAGYVAGRRSIPPGPLGADVADGPSVATFRGGRLPASAVEAELRAQPAAFRDQLDTPEARRALVEGLVRMEVLAREAERKGYHRDPDFVRRYKEELGRAFLEKELEEPQRKAPPTDAEVRAYYDANRASLARPERVRVAAISFLAAADDAARGAKRARAQAALAKVRRAPADVELFASVARAETEDAQARLTSGEQPFLTREELAERLGPEVADAAAALAPGAIAPAVVEAARGLHVVKLLGREDGYAPSFEELEEPIRLRLAAERRAAAQRTLLERVAKDAGVKLDDDAIAAVKLD